MAAPLPVARSALRDGARDGARASRSTSCRRTRAYAELWLDGKELARVGPADGSPIEQEPMYGKTYLPRKFKTCVTVAGDNSIDLFTHDLGLAGVFSTGGELEGWNVYVGGGLGRTHRKPETYPRLADPLGFIEPGDELRIAEAVVVVQRDWGDRTNRRHARLKYTIAERGIEWFRGEVERRVRRHAPAHPRGRRGTAATTSSAGTSRATARGSWACGSRTAGSATATSPASGYATRSGPSRAKASATASPPTRTCTSSTCRLRGGAPWPRSSPTTASRPAPPCVAWHASRWPAPRSRPAGWRSTEAERVIGSVTDELQAELDDAGPRRRAARRCA